MERTNELKKKEKKLEPRSPAGPATHVQLRGFGRESGVKDLSVFEAAEVDFRHVQCLLRDAEQRRWRWRVNLCGSEVGEMAVEDSFIMIPLAL